MDKRANGAAEDLSSSGPLHERWPGREEGCPGKVIAVLNQEGGVGKTSLATHLAGEFAVRGQ